ncbi:MAG: UDP-N-acetylmuramate:L-alanyl-gamma-D-glutamyl-meso-diaminopimelate ligase, partial [Syntrophobacteraceae bacterium]|nr:UDP-N-acetylmuramate:L-alanyl-gamma-D-glutamyl-meso-diaminopimelate ligase [Syntrophobacteraceae bacterium]
MKSSGDHKTIYLMGIGGIAMGTLAAMLKECGYEVMGSDQNLYPPMSTHLERLGIPLYEGYRPENLWARPVDLVIVGNVIRRENPEAQVVLEHGIPYMSMPEAIAHFFLRNHHSIVVAGTHGKSTTSSLAAWLLAQAGLDPSAFIGAFVNDWGTGFRLGKGPFMVLEGDEYDTAFFDKGPKFLHYKPWLGVITSVEFDHADIFPNLDKIVDAFRSFVRLIPADGYLIANGDDPICRMLAQECNGRVMIYGRSEHAQWRILEYDCREGHGACVYYDPVHRERRRLECSLMGRHNLGNALAALLVSSLAGVDHHRAQEALLS